MQKTCSRGHVFEKTLAVPSCPICWPGRYNTERQPRQFRFRAKVWMYPTVQAAWHFLTIPEKISASIKKEFSSNAKGWGAVGVEVSIGKTHWKTSVFPDRKRQSYILPLKAEVRKKEGIAKGDVLSVRMQIIARKS